MNSKERQSFERIAERVRADADDLTAAAEAIAELLDIVIDAEDERDKAVSELEDLQRGDLTSATEENT